MAISEQSSSSLQQIVLRQPQGLRGQHNRGSALPTTMLPVFFAGEENRFVAFVCGTATAADESPEFSDSLASMGPVLLVGPTGCGKSTLAIHLAAKLLDTISSTANVTDDSPEAATVMVISGIDFARLYARAVDSDDISRFRAELQSAKVLVVDDVHSMVDKPAAQDELAARLEARTADSLPTILTCRRLPMQVPGLRPLLVSRMLPGLTIPVRLPGPEACRKLVTTLAERRDFVFGEEEVSLLCNGLPEEVTARQIEGAIRHLELWCRMKSGKPNMVAIREAIASIEPLSDISTDQVAKKIARRYKIRLAELKSGTRRQEVVRARSLAMYLSRQLTGSSYDKIGKYFGGRDHTTVLHACRKTESMIESDDEMRITANEIADQLKATA
jgi:chromosomal replication initiator protein